MASRSKQFWECVRKFSDFGSYNRSLERWRHARKIWPCSCRRKGSRNSFKDRPFYSTGHYRLWLITRFEIAQNRLWRISCVTCYVRDHFVCERLSLSQPISTIFDILSYFSISDTVSKGLPNWRSPTYYMRKLRKMSSTEVFILVTIIATTIHYCTMWGSYLEKKMILDDHIDMASKRKKVIIEKLRTYLTLIREFLGPLPSAFSGKKSRITACDVTVGT